MIQTLALQQHDQNDDLKIFRQQFKRPWPKEEKKYLGFTKQNGHLLKNIIGIQNPFLRFSSSECQIEIYFLKNLDEKNHIGYWHGYLANQLMPLLQAQMISLIGRLETSEIRVSQTKSNMKSNKLETSKNKNIVNNFGEPQWSTMKFRLHLSFKSESFKPQDSLSLKDEESTQFKYVKNLEMVFEHFCERTRQIDKNSQEILQLVKQKSSEQQNQNGKNYSNDLPNDLFTNNSNTFPETEIDSLKLEPHQRQALTWLLYREGVGSVERWHPKNYNNPLWTQYRNQDNQIFYFCPFTGQSSLEKESFTGGILADENGFDEKLTMTALILRNPQPQGEQGIKTTLIVTSNQMDDWSRILQQTKLNVLVLQNDQAAVNLQIYDVVIISYYKLVQQWKILMENGNNYIVDSNVKIYNYYYYRVILDQASKIKNCKTQRAKACLNLNTHYRWCVTNQSLIQNDFVDLIALLQFINQKQMPFPNKWWFNKYITEPYQQNKRAIKEFIRDITVPSLILRRTYQSTYPNGELMITLPGVQLTNFKITFTPEERKAYEMMKDKMGGGGCCQTQKLLKICDYSKMSDIRPVVQKFSCAKLKELLLNQTLQQIVAFEQQVQNDFTTHNIICKVCNQQKLFFKVSNCYHYICLRCFTRKKIHNQEAKCSECQNPYTKYISIKYTFSEQWKQTYVRPSKIIIIRQILDKIKPGEKCVIFTQFIQMIDVLIHDLRHTDNPITCYFLHGAMPHIERQNQLNQFNKAQEKVVLVASLKANEGQDLTRAKHIIFVEPWWNFAVQDQAIHRVLVNERGFSPYHQIYVYKLITKDTIEDQIAQVNEEKRSLTGTYEEMDMEDSSDSD